MGAINNAFNRAGLSILSLASATAKYRARRNEEGKNRAKLNYSTAATIKKQNNELTKKQSEAPKSYLDINSPLPPEKDEQKIAEQKVLKQMAEAKKPVQRFGEIPTVSSEMDEQKIAEQKVLEQMAEEKTKAASFVELPTVSAENSETNISAKDPEVQGLIEVKQKNALRAVAGQRSQNRYQKIKAKLTSTFADDSYIEDVWRNISLAPDITDEMIRKAGYTKTKILEEWQWFKNSPSDWIEKLNIMGDEYGVGGSVSDADDTSSYGSFGEMLSAYIRAKAGGKTLAQQQEEYELNKAEKEPEEENYKVWQDDSTEEEKDEVKTDRKFSGFQFLQDEPIKEESTEKESTEEEKDEIKTDRNFSGIKF